MDPNVRTSLRVRLDPSSGTDQVDASEVEKRF
jgi:hypothetical protein